MLNRKVVGFVLSFLLVIEGFFLLTVIPVSLFYRSNDLLPILSSGLICIGIGLLGILLTRGAKKSVGKREGYLIVSLGWVILSLFGSLPFIIGGYIPNFTDAFFETISGFTTTGASILNDIEALPEGVLYWRSLTQWLGGMGIIVMSIAILPMLGIGGMQLFIAEVPGPTYDKLHPRIKETAKRLWAIYIILTFVEIILLWAGGMTLFEAVNHAYTTMATGGYSTKQASVAYWDSPFIHWVITVFMFLAGTNFTLSYLAMHARFAKIWRNDEFRFYLGTVVSFVVIIAVGLMVTENFGVERSFRDSAFQVVSIVTTTGYATADYLTWTPFLSVLIFLLMFFGGSAGSTGGGVKMVRILMLLKHSFLELRRIIHPNAVIPVRLNGRAVSQNIITNVLSFVFIYVIIMLLGVVAIAALGSDLDTSLGAVAATLGNIGPGIGDVGPSSNFYHFSPLAKWILSFLMLLGRLELFTVLVLFSRAFWRK